MTMNSYMDPADMDYFDIMKYTADVGNAWFRGLYQHGVWIAAHDAATLFIPGLRVWSSCPANPGEAAKAVQGEAEDAHVVYLWLVYFWDPFVWMAWKHIRPYYTCVYTRGGRYKIKSITEPNT